jgi:conjugative transfer signal peptidase TraF
MVQLDAPRWQVKPRALLATVLGCIVIAASTMPLDDRCLVINLTASVPVGLYVRCVAPPRTGNFVLVRLPMGLRQFAARRGYLPLHRLLLKIVVAGPGDVVCRLGARVWAGGHSGVWALRTDALGRPLPNWRVCRRLRASELFVLGSHSGSFDSRYFGPINRDSVLGTVRPIISFRLCDGSHK